MSSDERPPLDLHAEIIRADGTRFRWDPDSDAGSRPLAIRTGSQRMEGFSAGGCRLSRRIDLDWPDLSLLDTIAFVGYDGNVAYEGRLDATPRSLDGGHSIDLELAGWMTHGRDRKFSQVYLDREMSRWGEPQLARRAQIAASGYPRDQGIRAQAGDDGLVWDVDTGALPANSRSELYYDAGPGLVATKMIYRGARAGAFTAIDAPVVLYGDDPAFAAGVSSQNLTLDGAYHVQDLSPACKRLILPVVVGGAGATGGTGWQQRYDVIGVMGRHNVPLRGAAPYGVFASDVIKDIAALACPQLDTTGVQQTTYPIAHASFRDRIDPYDAWLDLNAYHLWNLAVWENRRLEYGPLDLRDYDWEVRLSDPGVKIRLQGDSAQDIANGAAVTYTSAITGDVEIVTPADSGDLRDTDPNNPANRAGIQKWIEAIVPFPTDREGAIQIGRAMLGEALAPKAPGEITITSGYIRDRGGRFRPGWEVRAGDTVAITDYPNDRPRLIHEPGWDHGSKTLTIGVDSTTKRLDAFFSRMQARLRIVGV